MRRPSSQLTHFYLYRGLMYFYLWLPIATIYKEEMPGLTLTQITAMGAVAWVVSALAEVPTGAVADVWGRRLSLAVGALVYAVALLGTGLGSSFWTLLLFGVLHTTAFSFVSGSDMAFLYDTLKAAGREDEYVKAQGKAMAVMFAAQGLAALIGSPLGSLLGPNVPYLVTVPLAVLAGAVALSLREPGMEPVGGKARSSVWSTFTETVQLARQNQELRYSLLYAAVTYPAAFLLFYILFQPYTQSIGLPTVWIGAGMVALRAVSLVGAHWADRVVRRIGEVPLLWLAPLGMMLTIMGMAVTPTVLSLVLMAGLMLLNAIHRPVISAVLNRQVDSRIRATVLSSVELLSILLVAAVQPVMGAIADRWGVGPMLWALGLGSGACTYLVLGAWRPGRPPARLLSTSHRSG